MIAKLTGIIEEIYQEAIIINVNNIGFLIYTTKNLITNLKVEDRISLYIEPHIYENNIKLYGFILSDEQEVLKLLVKVKGISHKIALNLIDNIGYANIIFYIREKNDGLLKGKGIGEKLTKRIVTELYEDAIKLSLKSEKYNSYNSNSFNGDGSNTANINNNDINNNNSYAEAISALINLGYSNHIANRIIKDISTSRIPEEEKEKPLSTSEIICLALKRL